MTMPNDDKPMSETATMKPEKHSCMCKLCADYEIEKFAELMACGCFCHGHGYTSHDGLCCSLPNVLPENHMTTLTNSRERKYL